MNIFKETKRHIPGYFVVFFDWEVTASLVCATAINPGLLNWEVIASSARFWPDKPLLMCHLMLSVKFIFTLLTVYFVCFVIQVWGGEERVYVTINVSY